jgi:glycosyltransferase involved in cell wall biosynthesis
MAGAACVATRLMGGGPYEVIRDGVDGLLARNKAQWRDALRSLAGSPDRRAELAGRARERVLAEYRAADRAIEWADAYRWAAEHAGRGIAKRAGG